MTDQMDLWHEPPTQESSKMLASLAHKLVEIREEKEFAQGEIKKLAEQEAKAEARLIDFMKDNCLETVKGDFGTVSLVFKKSIKMPENLHEKLKLFDYLKEVGIFEELVSVNSRSLNSWASKEIEEKESQGLLGWVPPGLKAPSEFADIRLTKTKTRK